MLRVWKFGSLLLYGFDFYCLYDFLPTWVCRCLNACQRVSVLAIVRYDCCCLYDCFHLRVLLLVLYSRTGAPWRVCEGRGDEWTPSGPSLAPPPFVLPGAAGGALVDEELILNHSGSDSFRSGYMEDRGAGCCCYHARVCCCFLYYYDYDYCYY